MLRTFLGIGLCAAASLSALWSAPSSLVRAAPQPAGAVHLVGVAMWASSTSTCTPGTTARSFPSSTAYLCVQTEFQHWRGTHHVALVFRSSMDRLSSVGAAERGRRGLAEWTVSVAVAGNPDLDHLGHWLMGVVVDGTIMSDVQYDLTSPIIGAPVPADGPTSTPALGDAATSSATTPPDLTPTPTSIPGPIAAQFAPCQDEDGDARASDLITSTVAEVGLYHVDGGAGAYPAIASGGSDGAHLFLWLYASEDNEGAKIYRSRTMDFQLVTDQLAAMSLIPAAPAGSNDVVFLARGLTQGTRDFGWMGFAIPNQDGIYTVSWIPAATGAPVSLVRLQVIAATRQVLVLSNPGACPAYPTFPTANTTAPAIANTDVATPAPESNILLGAGTCEGDDDNDDEGLPAGRRDYDLCQSDPAP